MRKPGLERSRIVFAILLLVLVSTVNRSTINTAVSAASSGLGKTPPNRDCVSDVYGHVYCPGDPAYKILSGAGGAHTTTNAASITKSSTTTTHTTASTTSVTTSSHTTVNSTTSTTTTHSTTKVTSHT